MIPFRVRPDLIVSSQMSGGQPCWVVKDPVTLKYFTFSDPQYGIMRMLDGSLSQFGELKERFERKFAPHRTSVESLQKFISELYGHGLLVSELPGESDRLTERKSPRTWWWNPANLLAIRLPGIDLDRFLTWLLTYTRWVFSPYVLIACLGLMVYALAFVWLHWSTLQSRLPAIETLFRTQNLVWLAIALSVTKLLHETGHALACKYFGGECHETGVILLVFTPCLYCDVSDSWVLTNRWHRMAIAGAGIFVDLVLATLATLAWVWSKPGLVSDFLLNVMIVCGLGTVLLNGNPLLRYDGYYLLSDLLDIPNLWGRSRRVVWQAVRRIGLGVKDTTVERPAMPLMVYGIASMIYRCVVLVAIVLMIYRLMSPLGYRFVADMITGGIVFGVTASMGLSMVRFARSDTRSQVRGARVLGSAMLVSSLLAGIIWVPLPSSVTGKAVFQYADADRVYVGRRGTLVDALEMGDVVDEHDVVAQLTDDDVSREVVKLIGSVERQTLRVDNLNTLQFDDVRAGEQIPAANELLRDLRSQLAEKQKDLDALQLRSPRPGTVLLPPIRRSAVDQSMDLPTWSGTPIDADNRNCTLERGTLFCLVGDPQQFEAIVVVDQADVGRFSEGATAQLIVASGPADVVAGRVRQVSRRDLQLRRQENDGVGGQASDEFAQSEALASASYQVRVQLLESAGGLLPGMTAQAYIVATPESVAARLRRWIRRNFILPASRTR